MKHKDIAITFLATLLLASLLLGPMMSLDIAPMESDNAKYFIRAYGIATGHGLVAIESPDPESENVLETTPILVAYLTLCLLIGGATPLAAKIGFYLLQAVFLVFFVKMFYEWTRSKLRTILLSLILLLSPILSAKLIVIRTDYLFLATLAIMMLLFSKIDFSQAAQHNSWKRFYLLGLLAGFLFLIRYVALLIIGAAGLWLIYEFLRERNKIGVRSILGFSVGVLTIIVLLVIGFSVLQPDFIPQYIDRHLGMEGAEFEYAKDSDIVPSKIEIFIEGAGYYFKILIGILANKSGIIGYLVAAVLIAIILLGCWAERKKPYLRFLLLAALVYYLGSCYANIHRGRYILPVFLFLLPLLYSGVIFLSNFIGKRLKLNERTAKYIPVAILSLFLFWRIAMHAPTIIACYQHGSDVLYSQERLDYRDALLWMQDRYPEETILWSIKTTFGYVYSRIPCVRLNMNDIVKYADRENIYFVRDSAFENTEAFYEYYNANFPNSFTLEHTVRSTKIYRVDPTQLKQIDSNQELPVFKKEKGHRIESD
ncbi:glycosyltransferase family 39 protein [bacterium]|nr:glycosyltransferase family 39 protein [bacterium]